MKLYIHFSVVAHFATFLFRLSLHGKQAGQPKNKEQYVSIFDQFIPVIFKSIYETREYFRNTFWAVIVLNISIRRILAYFLPEVAMFRTERARYFVHLAETFCTDVYHQKTLTSEIVQQFIYLKRPFIIYKICQFLTLQGNVISHNWTFLFQVFKSFLFIVNNYFSTCKYLTNN